MVIGIMRSLSARNSAARKRAAKAEAFLCAMALGTLLVSASSAQVIEGCIQLPDTFGPLVGPYHLAWDADSAHPRLYVGSESGDVVVAHAFTYKRLARIHTKPVHEMLYCPPHRKLYFTERDKDTLAVIDCVSNQVISRIPIKGRRPTMVYNRFNDRLYCGSGPLTVIDCATDSILHTISASGLSMAFDSTDQKLYCGSYSPLTVVDCTGDSVVAVIPRVVTGNRPLAYNKTASKVYAVTVDTLVAIGTDSDSVVSRLRFAGLSALLACDPQANRVYCWSASPWPQRLYAVDCAGDTSIYVQYFDDAALGLACDPLRDKVYITVYRGAHILNGSTGSYITGVGVDGRHSVPLHSPELGQVFCVPDSEALFAISCASDTVVGGVPTTVWPRRFCLDTVLNKLYFLAGRHAVGVVDCARNVTSYMWQCDEPEVMGHNPLRNKLYCGSRNGYGIVVVFDCMGDTAIKTIYVGGRVVALHWHPGRDKVYAFLQHLAGYSVAVIDCAADSVIGSIILPDYFPREQFLVPETDRLWILHNYGFAVVDTKYDSVVVDTLTGGWHTLEDACVAPADRKIYISGQECLYVIDMENTAHIESLPRPDEFYHYLYYAASARKLYWACRNDIGIPDSVYVVDTRTDSVVSKLLGASSTSGMCLDRSGDYVYASGSTDTLFYTIDTRTDSVVKRFRVPLNLQGFALNPRTHRIYCEPYWDDCYQLGRACISVIYDSAGVSLCDELAKPVDSAPYVTFIRRGKPLCSAEAAVLYDATGRSAAVLRPGLNDITYLVLGVYFWQSSADRQARKVLILR